MKILFPKLESEDSSIVSDIITDMMAYVNLPNAQVEYISYHDSIDFKESDGVVINVHDEESYWNSLNFIKLISQKIPYLYIASFRGNFTWSLVEKFKPTEFLVAPESKIEIETAIQSFLLKIYSTRNKNDKAENNEYIWLSLKRGVYQKLHFEAIKYIEAVDHYIRIYCDSDSLPLIKATLKGFYNQYLEARGNFYLLNRSCIINLLKVRKIENNQLFIDSNKPLAIPKNRRDEVLDVIGL
ncbi:MAG: LytTR family DNA-binding domain-containing protein [Bacteroidota bacterium]